MVPPPSIPPPHHERSRSQPSVGEAGGCQQQEDPSLERNQMRELKKRDQFFRGCIESLMLERKDRITHGGLNRMGETLNKIVMGTELARWLLLKRVHEISARMTLMHLMPGQKLSLEENSMYFVLDGKVRVSSHDQHALEAMKISHNLADMMAKRSNDTPTHIAGQAINKFKVAASTFIIFRKLGHNQSEHRS
jgi:hypothetical protein